MRVRVLMLLAAGGLLCCTATGSAQPYDVPHDRSAKDILAASALKGPGYRIKDVVATDGYTDRWTVESDFGTFEAHGDGALRKLLKEIWAIGELRKVRKSEAFARGLGGAAKAPLGFAKSFVTNPVDTVTGIPKGAYQIVENVATSATTTKDPSEDAKLAQALKMSAFKREYAARLDVDPYSSNKVLQKELNSVAWASTIGDWAFSAAMLPAGTAGSVVSNIRLTNSVKNAVKEEPPSRLRVINGEKLAKIGIHEDLRNRFLDHPVFTPRQDTIIALSLEQLGGVSGRDTFLALAATATDEVEAGFYTTMAQMLRGYHETVSPLTEIATTGRLAVAQTKAGPALVALPLDWLIWTERADQVSGQLKGHHRGAGFNGKVDLWLTGTASPRAREALTARGYAVVELAGRRIEILD